MIETSAEIGKIALAMSKTLKASGGALKDASNPFFNSNYADLESVDSSFRAAATENELAWTQGSHISADSYVVVVTLVMHSSGEWIRSGAMSKPKDLSPQSVGSAITYNRRYSLAAAFGVYQTDDDGNAAQGNKVSASQLDKVIVDELEAAAKKGVEAFRDYWKSLDKDTRKVAQSDKAWFDGLRKTAEGVRHDHG